MKDGLLLDTHILLWLDAHLEISPRTAVTIHSAGLSSRLFMSDISIWEVGVAAHKKSFERRPNLQGRSVQNWFQQTTAKFSLRQIRVSSRIALEAANVPGIYGSGDPGDCFLIATARIRKLALVTRDSNIIALAKRKPSYLDVLVC